MVFFPVPGREGGSEVGMKTGVRVVLSQTGVLSEPMDFPLPLPFSFGEGGKGGERGNLYYCILLHI